MFFYIYVGDNFSLFCWSMSIAVTGGMILFAVIVSISIVSWDICFIISCNIIIRTFQITILPNNFCLFSEYCTFYLFIKLGCSSFTVARDPLLPFCISIRWYNWCWKTRPRIVSTFSSWISPTYTKADASNSYRCHLLFWDDRIV